MFPPIPRQREIVRRIIIRCQAFPGRVCMVNAFVLITAKPGAESNLVGDLRGLDEVEDAWAVYGEYDVIALVSVEDLKDLDSFVTEKIRRLPDVQFTSTMICIR